MITYLQKDIPSRLAAFDAPISEANNIIGTTIADYYDGAWLPLTAEQTAFAAEHPDASAAEIVACELTPLPPRTLADAIAEKRAEIDAYDTSDAVNSFTLGGGSMWLDKATRVGLANSIAIEEAAGREVTTLWFGDTRYTLTITAAKQMLAALELYALACYNVTASHRYSVGQLTTIAEVDAYDYTLGYPSPLNLDAL